MRIALFGAGGVGGYFGGRLALAGENVVFIARGAHLQAMRTQGLRVESPKGNFTVSSVQATDDPTQVGPVDVILVAVKAWQVPEAAQAMRPMVGAETFVVPLQNGVEAAAQVAAVLGSQHVLGGSCVISSVITAPGCIRHLGPEPSSASGRKWASRRLCTRFSTTVYCPRSCVPGGNCSFRPEVGPGMVQV